MLMLLALQLNVSRTCSHDVADCFHRYDVEVVRVGSRRPTVARRALPERAPSQTGTRK
jgi:hypothetical protein